MQVDPGFSLLPPRLLLDSRDFQLLKLKHDQLLSNFAFNCNLRHYYGVITSTPALGGAVHDAPGLTVLAFRDFLCLKL